MGVLVIVMVAAAIYYVLRSGDEGEVMRPGGSLVKTNGTSEKSENAHQAQSWKVVDDPSKDGWDTEVFTNKAMKQLQVVGQLLTNSGEFDTAAVANLISDDFRCGALLPDHVTTVFDNQHLKIDRLPSPTGPIPLGKPSRDSVMPYQELSGLVQVMRGVTDSLSNAADLRFKFKVFRVVVSPDEIMTRQYFAISGRTDSGAVEQHATWDIGWTLEADEAPPRMQWLRVVEFEQAESRQPDGAIFVDCTESVLGDNSCYREQFLRGMNHWLERIQDPSPFMLAANPGLAVGDVNGDGLDDLYVCQEAGLPNRLFVQNSNGTAREVSESSGVNWLQSSRSALLVDLDNDSDQDLVVAILGGVVVAENDGEGNFRLRDVLPSGDDTMSLSAVDFDMDGRLDIYACVYKKDRRLMANGDMGGLPGAAAGFVVHDANNGGNNILFQNQIQAEGDWRFVDVTQKTGLNANNHRHSLAAAWDDFDNDGDQDLYVANDYGRDNLYRNDASSDGTSRKFVDISTSANVEDSATGMSITWGDYDRDGWMDAFVSNMWSSAGNRIAFQAQFRQKASPETKRRIQRLARGNTLLKNQGDGTFTDQSAPAGIEMGRWAWGSHFIDLNNDGWEDVLMSNGYITTGDTGDL